MIAREPVTCDELREFARPHLAVFKPPRELTLELALEYIEDDELVEVTPAAIRLRKVHLSEVSRKRAAKKSAVSETV